MNSLRGIGAALLLAPVLYAAAAPSGDAPERPIRFVITSFASPDMEAPVVHSTLEVFESIFGRDRISVRRLQVPALEEAVKNEEADILLSSAGAARRLVPYGARQLVTSVKPGLDDPNRNEGSAIVVRKDDAATKIADLRGKRLAANFEGGFSGYQIAMGEVAFAGFDPERFFSSRTFFGRSEAMPQVAGAVVSGRADVGIMRLCAFEDLQRTDPETASRLRFLPPPEVAGGSVACVRSTRLYPAHTISVMPTVSPELSRRLLISLLTMEPQEDGRTWSVATDFQSVDHLLEKLMIGPYAYLRDWTFKRFMTEFWPAIALFLALVLGLFLHSLRADQLVRRTQAELGRAHELREEQARKIEALQRTGAVNQISSLIAHEIHQPLSAILLYAGSLERRSRQGAVTADTVKTTSEKIAQQAERARRVVDRVRDYARRRDPVRRAVNARAMVSDLAANQSAIFSPVRIEYEGTEKLYVWGSRLELALVLLNVVRNAAEAARKTSRPRVALKISSGGDAVIFTVSDNGPPVSDETFERLADLVTSEKPDGLGMGLSIVKNIVEAHKGKIEFMRNGDEPGITVRLSFPRIPTDGKEA